MRGVFNVPLAGAEELAKYFLICLTFVAAAYVTRGGRADPHGRVPGAAAAAPALDPAAGDRDLRRRRSSPCCSSPRSITVSRNLNSVTPVLEIPFWLFFAPLVARLVPAAGRDAHPPRAHLAQAAPGREAHRAHLTAHGRLPRRRRRSSSSSARLSGGAGDRPAVPRLRLRQGPADRSGGAAHALLARLLPAGRGAGVPVRRQPDDLAPASRATSTASPTLRSAGCPAASRR